MKSLGNISGIALKLMFLIHFKSKMNEGENRTIIERIINVFISGTTTVQKRWPQTQKNSFVDEVQFILPDDTKEAIEFF
jgi:hypothetical protein